MPTDERARRVGCVVGIVLIVLLVLAIAIPNLMAPRIQSNESFIIGSMRAYVSAQREFRKVDRYGIGRKVYANPKDGVGFRDLYHIGYDGKSVPGKPVPHLIEQALADADVSLAKPRPMAGYLFVDITGDADGPYDYTTEFGLCAVPLPYSRSGRNMFIVDPDGHVFQSDASFHVPPGESRAEPVTTWPDLRSWIPVDD